MRIKLITSFLWALCSLILSTLMSFNAYAQEDGLGQTIQIYTNFRTFVGHPVWLLIIHDLDHGQRLPYLYEIKRGDHFWIAYSYSRNYTITISNLKFDPTRRKIRNFCNLENTTMHGESLYITLDGDLSTDTSGFNCNVTRFKDSNFSIAPQATSQPDPS